MSLRSLLALSILPLGFPMASAAQPQDRDRATLSGRVVYDDTGHPVRHAAITLIDAESQQTPFGPHRSKR